MLTKVFAIRDAKAETFGPPFYQGTHGEAERSFRQLVNDEKSNVKPFPEDYDLYYLGEYDNISGKLFPIETPLHIVKAVQLVSQPTAFQ